MTAPTDPAGPAGHGGEVNPPGGLIRIMEGEVSPAVGR
jgi:hypothetical protein